MLPQGPDPKWRFFWRIGERAKSTEFEELNAAPVIPKGSFIFEDFAYRFDVFVSASSFCFQRALATVTHSLKSPFPPSFYLHLNSPTKTTFSILLSLILFSTALIAVKQPSILLHSTTFTAFPHWKKTMDTWGKLLSLSADTVAQMAALGLSLPQDAFTSMAECGSRLLAPTGRFGLFSMKYDFSRFL